MKYFCSDICGVSEYSPHTRSSLHLDSRALLGRGGGEAHVGLCLKSHSFRIWLKLEKVEKF